MDLKRIVQDQEKCRSIKDIANSAIARAIDGNIREGKHVRSEDEAVYMFLSMLYDNDTDKRDTRYKFYVKFRDQVLSGKRRWKPLTYDP